MDFDTALEDEAPSWHFPAAETPVETAISDASNPDVSPEQSAASEIAAITYDPAEARAQAQQQREEEKALAAQERAQQKAYRVSAKDLSRRGIGYYTDLETGAPRTAMDESGAPLTNFDHKTQIGYDSAGAARKLAFNAQTGEPELRDPYADAEKVTDKSGYVYSAPKGLPWRFEGTNPEVAQQAQDAKEEKLDQQTATALAGPVAMQRARYEQAQKAVHASQKNTATTLQKLGVPMTGQDGTPIDLTNTDPAELRTMVQGAFDSEMASPEANDKQFFGSGLSQSAQALRQDIANRQKSAQEALENHIGAVGAMRQAGSDYDQARAPLAAINVAKLNRLNENRVAAGLPPVQIPAELQRVAKLAAPPIPGMDHAGEPETPSAGPAGESGIPGLQSGGEPASTAPKAEGALQSFLRPLVSKIVPAAGTAIGGVIGGAGGGLLGSPSGPGAIATAIVGDIVGGAAGGALAQKAQNAIMGGEWTEQNQKQMAENAKEHPYASMAGEALPMLLSMLGGSRAKPIVAAGEGVKKAAQGLLSRTVGATEGNPGLITKAMTYLAEHSNKLPLVAKIGARISGAETAEQDVTDKKDFWNVLPAAIKGAATFGPTAFFPLATTFMGNAAKGLGMAGVMEVSNALYDHFVEGKKIDIDEMKKQFAKSGPAFAAQEVLLGMLHGSPAKLPESQKPLLLEDSKSAPATEAQGGGESGGPSGEKVVQGRVIEPEQPVSPTEPRSSEAAPAEKPAKIVGPALLHKSLGIVAEGNLADRHKNLIPEAVDTVASHEDPEVSNDINFDHVFKDANGTVLNRQEAWEAAKANGQIQTDVLKAKEAHFEKTGEKPELHTQDLISPSPEVETPAQGEAAASTAAKESKPAEAGVPATETGGGEASQPTNEHASTIESATPVGEQPSGPRSIGREGRAGMEQGQQGPEASGTGEKAGETVSIPVEKGKPDYEESKNQVHPEPTAEQKATVERHLNTPEVREVIQRMEKLRKGSVKFTDDETGRALETSSAGTTINRRALANHFFDKNSTTDNDASRQHYLLRGLDEELKHQATLLAFRGKPDELRAIGKGLTPAERSAVEDHYGASMENREGFDGDYVAGAEAIRMFMQAAEGHGTTEAHRLLTERAKNDSAFRKAVQKVIDLVKKIAGNKGAMSERLREGIEKTQAVLDLIEKPESELGAGRYSHLINLNSEQLGNEHRAVKDADKNLERDLFGEEGAKRYRLLLSKENSYDSKIADAAYEERSAMEEKLTEKQRNRLFGIGDSGYVSPEEIRDIQNAVNFVENAESPDDLGNALKFAAVNFEPDAKESELNFKQAKALAEIKAASRLIQEKEWNPNEVAAAMVQHAASRFHDPDDAALMLGKLERFFGKAAALPLPESREALRRKDELGATIPGMEDELGAGRPFIKGGNGPYPEPYTKAESRKILDLADAVESGDGGLADHMRDLWNTAIEAKGWRTAKADSPKTIERMRDRETNALSELSDIVERIRRAQKSLGLDKESDEAFAYIQKIRASNPHNPDRADYLPEESTEPVKIGRASIPETTKVHEFGNASISEPGTIKLGASKPLIAHHGTPHEVDKFSTDKIGTGEGAQVYGWGLYFAENPTVAEMYRKNLAQRPPDRNYSDDPAGWVQGQLFSGVDEGTLKRAIPILNPSLSAPEIDQQIKDGRKRLETSERKGNTYTVHLDADDDELLDWDRPLSEQSEKVKAALLDDDKQKVAAQIAEWEKRAVKLKAEGGDTSNIERRISILKADLSNDRQFDLGGTGARHYEFLSRGDNKNPKTASEHLRKLGILGIRYLDQGSRSPGLDKYRVQWDSNGELAEVVEKSTGKSMGIFDTFKQADAWVAEHADTPTYNYVMFDDSRIKITHKNGNPVAISEALGASKPDGIPGLNEESKPEEQKPTEEKALSESQRRLGGTSEESATTATQSPAQKLTDQADRMGVSYSLDTLKKLIRGDEKATESMRQRIREAGEEPLGAGNPFRNAWDKLKEGAEAFKNEVKGAGTRDSIVSEYDGGITISNYRAQHALDSIKLDMPDKKDREAMPFVIEAGGDKSKLAAEVAKIKARAALDPKAKPFLESAERAMNDFDRLNGLRANHDKIMADSLARLKAAGIEVGEVDNYVTRKLELPENLKSAMPIPLFGGSGSGGSSRYFFKGRSFETLGDAILAGYMPKSTDLADLDGHRIAAGERVLEMKKYIDNLKATPAPTDGKPIIGQMETRQTLSGKTEQVVPKGYDMVNIMGRPTVVHRQFADTFRNLFSQSAIRNNPVGRALLKFAAVGKHGSLVFDTFHVGRMLYKMASGGGGLPVEFDNGKLRWGFNRGLSLLEYSDADLDRAVKQGIYTPREVAWAKANRADVQDLMKAGLNVGQVADNLMGQAKMHIPILSGFNDWIFQKMSRGAMVQTATKALERNLKEPGVTREQALRKTAKEMNEYFGNLQNQGLFTNKTMQDVARLVFLAPGWTESQARYEGRAYAQAAKSAYKFLRSGGKERFVGNSTRAMAAGFVGLLAANQVINFLSRGQSTFQNEEEGHKMDAFIPGGKRGFWFDPAEIAAEYFHAAEKYAAQHENPVDIATHIASNKLSPLGRGTKEALSGRDFSGRHFLSNSDRATAAISDVLPSPLPLGSVIEKDPRQPLGYRLTRQPGALEKQLLQSAGAKVTAAQSPRSQMFAIAQPFRADRGKTDTAGEYTELRRALDNDDNAGVKSEIKWLQDRGHSMDSIAAAVGLSKGGAIKPEMFAGSKEREQEMLAKLTPKQKEIYAQAQREHAANAMKFLRIANTVPRETAPKGKPYAFK